MELLYGNKYKLDIVRDISILLNFSFGIWRIIFNESQQKNSLDKSRRKKSYAAIFIMRTIRVDNQAIFSASNTARSSSRLPLTLDFAPVKQIFHDTRSHQEDHLQVQKKPIHCTLL
jgi:hypothetical protein